MFANVKKTTIIFFNIKHKCFTNNFIKKVDLIYRGLPNVNE